MAASSIRHPRVLLALVGVLLLGLGGSALGYLNLRNLQRIELIRARLGDLERIRELRHRLEVSLLDDVREAIPVGSFLATDVRIQIEDALALQGFLDPQTAGRLRQIADLLSYPGLVTRSTLASALELAGAIQEAEARAQEELLVQTQQDGRREIFMGIGVLAALAGLTAVGSWLLPKRLLNPLAGLRDRFDSLAEGRFEEVPLEGLDPGLLPLFQNYNSLVGRLEELEEERRQRARTLEEEVRSATRALVGQQRSLADAQRLAAVGETAARVAHELRNPLAGILASLENLRREARDPATLRRVDLLHAEAERIVRLLNEYLASARHEPEAFAQVDLRDLVQELLELLRYQVPGTVTLEADVPGGLACHLPRDRIRQLLLNLVWNAVEAMGDRPGRITLTAIEAGKGIALEVRDDGPGFPEGLLASPIQAFRTRRQGGTGLGLAMVQRTVRELGGEVDLSNRESGGACVRLLLPHATVEAS